MKRLCALSITTIYSRNILKGVFTVDNIYVVKYRKFIGVTVCMAIYEDIDKMNFYPVIHFLFDLPSHTEGTSLPPLKVRESYSGGLC